MKPQAISPINAILRLLDDVDERQHALAGEELDGQSLGDLITHLDAVRNLHARLKEIAADVNQFSERLSTQHVPDAMRAAGFTTVNHAVGRVSVSSRVSATMTDKHGAISWLKDHDLGELVIETVNAQTLSAQARAMLEAGDELPETYFKTSLKTYTSITKPGPRGQRKFRPIEEENE